MRVQILPFGVLKDVLRASPLDLPAQTTVAQMIAVLQEQLHESPASARLLRQIAVSINAEYARPDQLLQDGDVVGLLPPVSGGSDRDAQDFSLRTWLTSEAIPAERIVREIRKPSDGAVVVFDGIVRDNTRGRQTLHLDYEAYEDMAEHRLSQLAKDAINRFGVRAVSIVHRLGHLNIGETSVLIAVASAHRGPAFEASRWLIDTLKKTVPIWKKETFVDGVVWSDGEPFPPELVARTQDVDENTDVLHDNDEEPNAPFSAPEAAL